ATGGRERAGVVVPGRSSVWAVSIVDTSERPRTRLASQAIASGSANPAGSAPIALGPLAKKISGAATAHIQANPTYPAARLAAQPVRAPIAGRAARMPAAPTRATGPIV